MKAKLREVPEEIGVYLFYDRNGQVIYVGKAVNLRRRISQYFNCSRKRMEYRIQQMSLSISDIDWIVQESELHALLLEDRLIKAHWPMYNARQKKFLRNRYLTFTDEDYPRLRILNPADKEKSQKPFGPFPDDFFVLDLLEMVYTFFPIRNCDDAVPSARCQNHKLMNCSAPCREEISKTEYQRIVEQVKSFLKGNTHEAIRRLEDQIEDSVKGLQFERAGELRDQMIFCKNFMERQQFYDQFREKGLIIREWGSTQRMYLFHRGNLAQSIKGHLPMGEFLRIGDHGKNPIGEGERESDSIFLDKANVVYSWLKNKKTKKTYKFI
ncbi:MAG: GIY-YIG nuclease family protein [Proteobacteria bacterium]|nr:GIY-YIG nuclease family protein [Pseudomonadota bacterium]